MVRKCVFSYFISENKVDIPHLPVKKEFGKYSLAIDGNTPYMSAANESVACAIYGLAVNVISGESDKIADEIVEKCTTIQDVIAYENHLGGKYILLFRNGERYYLLGDATCSIPAFYNTDGAFVCSCNEHNIVNIKNYHADPAFSAIRASGDISQAMPYDVTPYKQIKQLLPNHYLDITEQRAVRFVNSECPQKPIEIQEATSIVLPMIENLLHFYQSNFKIYCPITSGRDSRVVLAFLMKTGEKFSCYTIKHPEHHEHTQDIVLPIDLCQKVNIDHRLIEDIAVPETLKAEMDHLLGPGNYSPRTLQIAHTINEYFGDGAILNGDIIGQVGKCSLHRDIPAIFATSSYFRCKLHNYSKGAKMQLQEWLEEIKASGEKVNLFDLFSIENRMGRWAGQENLIYNTVGQVYLNIFNCRGIIYTWSAVDRKKRKHSMLHIALVKKACAALLSIPFEKDESFLFQFAKFNGGTYLLSSYLKYYVEKVKFIKGNEHEKTDNYC